MPIYHEAMIAFGRDHQRGSAEQGVGQRVGHCIGIGMTVQPHRMGNLDAAENQLSPGRETMGVITIADSDHAAASTSSISE